MSDTWDSAPLAPAAPAPTGTWDAAPLAGPSPQQKAVLSATDNGDEAAKALQIQKKTNIPATVVQSDLPGYDAHMREQSAIKAVQNPALAKYIDGNPMAARVSNDDYDKLDEVSQTLKALHPELIRSKAQGGVLAGISEIAELAKTDAGVTKLTNALIALPYNLGKSVFDFIATPGKVATGEVLPGGEEAIGFGLGVALGMGGPRGTLRVGRTGEAPKPGGVGYTDFDTFMTTLRGMKTREEIDAFIASKTPGPPGAMLQIEHAKAGSAALDKAVEVAQDSKTKARSPELFEEAAGADDPGVLHVDAKKIVELYQKEGKVPAEDDGLLGFVPGLAEKAQTAAVTGGEVTIPIAKYLAHVDPAVHERLKDSIRLHDDGVTLEEAEAAKTKIEAFDPTKPTESDIAPPESDKIRFYHGTVYEDATGFTGETFVTPYYQYAKDYRGNDNNVLYTDFTKEEAIKRGLYDEVNDYPRHGPISDGAELLKPIKAKISVEEELAKPIIAEKQKLGLDTRVFMNMVFEKGKSVGITETEFKRYSDLIARQEQHILDKAVASSRAIVARSLTPEWKRNEAAVTTEVTEEFRTQGVFAAERYLHQNKIELGGDNIDQVADDLAPLWGFTSGNDLRDALTNLETVQAADRKSVLVQEREAIKAEVARRMEERYGNLAENIAKEARQIALSEHTFDILAEEVRILSTITETAPTFTRAQMVDWARRTFEASNIRDAANWQKHRRAVERGFRDTETALLKGDFQEAFQAKQRQQLAAEVAKQSNAFQQVLDSAERKIDRFSSEETIPSIDQAHLEQLRQMLASIGLPQQFAPLAGTPSLRDFTDAAQGQIAVAPWLMDGTQPKLQDMSVGQFRDFVKSMQSLEHAGRDAMKLENAYGEALLENTVGDIVKSLERFPFIDQPAYPSMAQRAGSIGRKIIGMHLLVERAFDYTDRFDPHGPLTEWIDRPLRDANSKEIALTEQVVRMLKDARQFVDATVNDKIENNLIPDANDKSGFLSMTRQDLRNLMLNTGNWSNMRKATEGFGINEADLRRFIARHASADDVAWVNSIWSVFAFLKPEADAVQLKDTGVPIDTIEAVPWELGGRLSNQGGGKLTGGYYPLAYDKYNSDINQRVARPLFDNGYFAATTPHGYTETRTQYTGALDLTGTFLSAKIQGMVHDIAFRLAVRNANKLIEHQEFRTAVAQYWGKEVADLLPGWIRDIANSHNLDDNYAQGFVRAAALIRQNVTSTLIAYNPGTFIKHGFTAFIMSIDRVGLGKLLSASSDLEWSQVPKNIRDLVSKSDRLPDEAFMQATRDLLDQGERGENARQFILDSSAVMRNRNRQYEDSIRGATDALTNIGPAQTFAEFRQRQMQYGRLAVAFSDMMSANPTWWAAYKKAYQAGEAHADAVFIADKEMSRAHGSSFVGDQPAVTRIKNGPTGELARWFVPLYKFWNHQVNNNFQLVWDASAAFGGNKGAEPGANALSISRRVGYVMAIIVIEEMASAAKDEDKHGLLTKSLLASLRYFGAGFVGARELTNGLAGGYEPSTGMIGTLFKAGSDTVKDIGRATGVKAGVAKDWIKHTATTLGFLTGLGGSQVGRTGQFSVNVVSGRERPMTVTDWRQGLRTGSMKARKH